jgi:hypothetical protein
MGFVFLHLKINSVNQKSILQYIQNRINLVKTKQVTNAINYSNGILFHAIPTNFSDKNKNITTDEAKNVFKHLAFSGKDSEVREVVNGKIELNNASYNLLLDNEIIESFILGIVKQTPINFPPKIRYVQVESVITHCSGFIDGILKLSKHHYSNKISFTIMITLLGIKDVVFNATDRDYTTTINFPKESLTFQINIPNNKGKEELQESIEEALHKTLYEYDPIA